MESKRQWTVLTAVVCLAVLAGGWLLLVSPQHKRAASLNSQAQTVTTATQSLQAKLAMLVDESRNLASEQAALAGIVAQLPSNPALPTLLRKLDAAAVAARVDLVNVAPGLPVVFTVTPLPVSVAVRPATAHPGATASAVPVAAAGTTTVPGLATIPVVLTVSGGYFQAEHFVDMLEGLSRSMLVDSFTIAYKAPTAVASTAAGASAAPAAPTVGAGELNLTINARVFMSTIPFGAASSVPLASR